MASEYRSEKLRLFLVWTESLQLLASAAASMIEENSRKGTSSRRLPEDGPEMSLSAGDLDYLRCDPGV